MSATPTVGAVVLNYNGKRYLDACLSSLLAVDDSEERLRIVLADNGSTDGSIEHVETNYPRVKILPFGENLGFATGNNRAAKEIATDYLLTLNNDTQVEPDFLEHLVAACEAGADAAGARLVSRDGTDTQYCGGSMNFLGVGRPATEAPNDMEPFDTLFACGGAMLMKRDLFLKVGGFDDDFFMFAEDVDLGWRLNILGYRVVAVPRAVVRHTHGGSLGSTDTAFHKSLSIRNPMLAMVKNYEEANLKKALPAALLLAVSRVMSHLGVEGYDEPTLSAFEERLAAGTTTDRNAVVMAMANMAALHGFLGLLDGALKKRETIQTGRKLSDAAIAQKFQIALGYEQYMAHSNYGVSLLRLAEYFDLAALLKPARLDAEQGKQLRRLDEHLMKQGARLHAAEQELAVIRSSRAWRIVSRLFGITRRLGLK